MATNFANLTEEEQLNLKTYNAQAEEWMNINKGINTLEPDFQKFSSYLSSGKIIDLGCGFGKFAYLFLKNGYDYLGVDFSETMIELAKKEQPKAKFEVKDITQLDYPEHSFDGFWAISSLLHVPKSKINQTLRGIKRIIKPKGIGLIILKQGKGEEVRVEESGKLKRFYALYEQNEFKEILEQNGFKVLVMEANMNELKKHPILKFFVQV